LSDISWQELLIFLAVAAVIFLALKLPRWIRQLRGRGKAPAAARDQGVQDETDQAGGDE
jgi:Sec-independent protein translocase protein TatA